ncbi:protein muscleblind-like [Temnothorax nylanderi]|uniref:protein muscleblind-like n=1 Tax=Temnothorax nylanderi TaxID=102681 RepID=UPI003A89B58C
MAMVNMNNLLNGKDSRWLQLEVCREFQRNKCTRPDTECKFAHPPANVEVQNGRVTACYDSIKVTNRCIIEFSYSRVTSAFARSGIVGSRLTADKLRLHLSDTFGKPDERIISAISR